MKKSIGIGEVAEILGVCVTTLRRWNKEKRQAKTLKKELLTQNNSYQIIEDLGSGLNFKKRGLKTF